MKSGKILLGSALVLGAMASAQVYAGVLTFTAATGSIINSKHDLSKSSTATKKSATVDDVCVFCHTPHAGNATLGPLWNRGGVAPVITPYTSATMDSVTQATLGTQSAACMTCHDGVTALDNLINSPGSGGYIPGGSGNGGPMGTLSGAIVTNIGNGGGDLSNDHPIGVAYCGGFLTAATGCVDPAFVIVATDGQTTAALIKNGAAANAASHLLPAASTAATKWWIGTTATPTNTSSQNLVMYSRQFVQTSGTGAGTFFQPSIECATCHDVHNAGNGTFLRVQNNQSRLCFACHVK